MTHIGFYMIFGIAKKRAMRYNTKHTDKKIPPNLNGGLDSA